MVNTAEINSCCRSLSEIVNHQKVQICTHQKLLLQVLITRSWSHLGHITLVMDPNVGEKYKNVHAVHDTFCSAS